MSEKNKAISLVGLIILTLSMALLYQGISFSNKTLEQSIETAEKSMNNTLLSIQEYSFSPYKARIKNFIEIHPSVVEAFARQNRELLFQRALSGYKALQKENENFQVMHFHLPDATTLLRMHDPEYYGDNLKTVRPIVDLVHKTKTVLTGYEIGRHGPFYRIVSPVFYQNEYIGAIEFGINVHEVLALLEQKTSHTVTCFFNKDEWKKITVFSTHDQLNIGGYVLFNPGDPLIRRLPSDIDLMSGNQQIRIDQKDFVIHLHPIFTNFEGKIIGGLVVLQDISALIAEKNNFIIKVIVFTALLLLISFFILYFTFGEMIAKLVSAEKYASKAKAEWERTFDAVPDMISILDDQHRIVRVNKAMVDSLGFSFQDVIHSKYHKLVHGSDEPPSHCPHVKLLQDHQSHSMEMFDERTQRYMTVTAFPLEDSEGNFFGAVNVARDITEQKIAEQQRIATEDKLQKAEKMEAIGLLAGGVAHDLNNILSGVVSYPEVLLMQLSSDDKLYEPIKAIQESGERAAAVVADLLTVARGVATVKEIHSPNILIKEYLDSTEFKNLQSLNPEVTIESQLADDLWNINCSAVHIQKVVMNLITNAVEAIDHKGSVLVTTRNQELSPSTIASSSLDVGEYVIVTIKDTGAGIAKHDLEHIFEPFYTKKIMDRSGTGLGLAVVWNTMKDHDAFIQVASDDSGSTFTLYFPPCRDKAVEHKRSTDITRLKGSGTILVVDDEQQQRELASKMLTLLGYSVITAASGEEAIEYCKKSSVDLVLLDMLMEPGINGLETYQQILSISPSQKAVIASGFSESNSVVSAKELGVGSFIKKPYGLEQIGMAVKKELNC